jgi:membrane fusion protein (multidrug efflux system)
LQLRKAVAGGNVRGTESAPVTILLEDGTRYEHEGELSFTDVSVDRSTGSFSLRVIVPNPDHLLLPGMYVRAVLSNAVLEDGILVPQQGIARDAKGNASAMVVAADGTVEQRSVEVIRTIGDKWLVNSGLDAGDRVIVEGLQKVQPGMPVEANEAAAAADAGRNGVADPQTTAAGTKRR